MPSARCRSGRKRSSERGEVGLARSRRPPTRAGRRPTAVEVVGLVREARRERLDRGGHRVDVGAGAGRGRRRGASAPSGCLQQAQRVGRARAARATPGPRRRRGGPRRPARREGVAARPSGRGSPQRRVVELADAVVAEEVGVGEHDDAALRRARRRRAARRRAPTRVGDGAREHPRALGPRVQRRRRGRSRLATRASRSPRPRALAGRRGPSAAPGGGARSRWTVSLLEAERRSGASSSLRLLPYFSCSLSPSTSRPPPRATKRLDRVELGVGEPRRAAGHDALPARVGGVGDDEDVGARRGRRRSSGPSACAATAKSRRAQRVGRAA